MNRTITLINSLGIVKNKKLNDYEQHMTYISKFIKEYGINIVNKNPVYDLMALMNYQILSIYTSYDETIIYLPYIINDMQYKLTIDYLNKNNKYIVVTSNNIKEIYKEYMSYDEVTNYLNESLNNYNRINKVDVNNKK